MGETLRLALNGRQTEIHGLPATTTLLDWLRVHAKQPGTKEGCAEGDCGACTVVLERIDPDGSVISSAVNSCLTMLGQADGLGVRTVEGVASDEGELHPIQSAMVETGGTQCGFCTPGFVMTAYAFFASQSEKRDLPSIHDVLAGNLCRCTGYRPIIDAILKVAAQQQNLIANTRSDLAFALKEVSRVQSACFEHENQRFFAPRTLAEALELRSRYPQATVLAGGTDLSLLVSQKREKIPLIIHVANVGELERIEERTDTLIFGAAVTYTEALDILAQHYPELHTYLTRLGSRQIRNMGTLGGNIGTASPIGDTLPILLALGARVHVVSTARGRRDLAAEQFLIGYRRTTLEADELIEAVVIPKPSAGAILSFDKISKRRDQDISTVSGAYRLVIQDGIVHEACLAFGGMAATAKRALNAEKVLIGRRFDTDTVAAAGEALATDFQPLGDWRGSAEYRLTVAKNLLRRFYWRIAQPNASLELEVL